MKRADLIVGEVYNVHLPYEGYRGPALLVNPGSCPAEGDLHYPGHAQESQLVVRIEWLEGATSSAVGRQQCVRAVDVIHQMEPYSAEELERMNSRLGHREAIERIRDLLDTDLDDGAFREQVGQLVDRTP